MVTLRKLALDDWQAVHSRAGLEEACRYQSWGPNTEDQTRAFVRTAVEAWSHAHQRRFAYVARFESELVFSILEAEWRSQVAARTLPAR